MGFVGIKWKREGWGREDKKFGYVGIKYGEVVGIKYGEVVGIKYGEVVGYS